MRIDRLKSLMTLLVVALGLCLTFAGLAAAQTADGQTPAEEDVCDGESGAAYGLCNAYCEAMDCHLDEPSASATACQKVGSRFEQITGRRPPCDLSCPCYTAADLQQGTIAVCGDNFPGFNNLAGVIYTDGRRGCSGIFCGSGDPTVRSCAFQPITGGIIIELLDEEEDAACRALILENCPNPNVQALEGAASDSELPFIDQ